MEHYGYIKTAAITPKVKVGNTEFNSTEIIKLAKTANRKGAQILVFPELAVTGYTAGDLFGSRTLLNKSREALKKIISATNSWETIIVVGAPFEFENKLFNAAFVIKKGQVIGIVPKMYLPNYKEFYEKRWFNSSSDLKNKEARLFGQIIPVGADLVFQVQESPNLTLTVEICEDLWMPIPPSTYAMLAGANIGINLSASNELVSKADYRKELVKFHSSKLVSGYIYVSAGIGESTTDVVYGGHSIITENGRIIKESEKFIEDCITFADLDFENLSHDRMQMNDFGETKNKKDFRIVDSSLKIKANKSLDRYVDAHPFVPSNLAERSKRCEEIFNIQAHGLAKRLKNTGITKMLLGLSGGLDSTLALLVAVRAAKILGISNKEIYTYSMPGFGTTSRTKNNAYKLAKILGVKHEIIDIKKAVNVHFKDISQNPKNQDITFQNAQARYRTLILLDKANQLNGLVIGTGDLSEIALGFATFNGDHISHYHVNSGVPKTLVRYLVDWVAGELEFKKAGKILLDILATPVSPELTRVGKKIDQETEKIIGPYELHDFFLFHFIRFGNGPKKILYLAQLAFDKKYTKSEIKKWLKVFVSRFFGNQWKRSVMPDGPKVGSVALSPRGDWRMPSDADVKIFMKELKNA